MLFFKRTRKTGIAVIEMHGVIGTAVREPDYTRLFEQVRDNRKIGALVLDIDSPGGSATASDILYENLRQVAEKKPVVAYVRGLGRVGRLLHRLRRQLHHGIPRRAGGLHRRHLSAAHPATALRQGGR